MVLVNNYIFYKKSKFNVKFLYHNKVLLKHLKFNKIKDNEQKNIILKIKKEKYVLNLIKTIFIFNKFNLKTLSRYNLIDICILLLQKNISFLFYIPL
jgi:hypothetical protein